MCIGLFKKTRILNDINYILEQNCLSKLDELVFREKVKDISLFRNVKVSLINDISEVLNLLIELQFIGTDIFYTTSYQTFYPYSHNVAGMCIPRYEFINEQVTILQGNATVGKTKILEKDKIDILKKSSFDESKTLIFIKTVNQFNKIMIRPQYTQNIYIYIPESII